jgi:lysophospholipase L1-like esterase
MSMKKKTQVILLILLTTITIFLLLGGLYKEKETKNALAKRAVVYNAEQKERQEKIKLREQSIYEEIEQFVNEDFPGIIAWGDSLTAGTGGEGTTYTDVLQSLIKTNILTKKNILTKTNIKSIPVINMGVGGEGTQQIMGRAGSIPFIVNSFTIDDSSKVRITIKLPNGDSANILRQGDKGVNPVTINGTSGIITIEQDSFSSQEYTYYFNRTEPGAPVNVEDGTIMTTAAATSTDIQNYIPIVFMGQNGGWGGNPEELITQIKSILNMDKWNNKYLVLGLTSGTAESSANLELAMASEFGDRYINLREYIVKNGLEQQDLDATKADMNAINKGAIPPSLLSDTIHFNSSGYKVIGQAVYDRMIELGYFDNILELIDELNSL